MPSVWSSGSVCARGLEKLGEGGGEDERGDFEDKGKCGDFREECLFDRRDLEGECGDLEDEGECGDLGDEGEPGDVGEEDVVARRDLEDEGECGDVGEEKDSLDLGDE